MPNVPPIMVKNLIPKESAKSASKLVSTNTSTSSVIKDTFMNKTASSCKPPISIEISKNAKGEYLTYEEFLVNLNKLVQETEKLFSEFTQLISKH